MSMMITELYDALRAAGAPEEKARAAAQALSEESLATKADIARLERELLVVKWMTGGIVAGVVSLLLRSFFG
ncbi:MAG: integrase [Deltaproteobacteria bacterium]|nr:integrase [Deltaproteobacteria bacterium]